MAQLKDTSIHGSLQLLTNNNEYGAITNDNGNLSITTAENAYINLPDIHLERLFGTGDSATKSVSGNEIITRLVDSNFDDKTIKAGKLTLEASDASIISIKRTQAGTGAFIDYYANNKTNPYVRAGMFSDDSWGPCWNGVQAESLKITSDRDIKKDSKYTYTLPNLAASGNSTEIITDETAYNKLDYRMLRMGNKIGTDIAPSGDTAYLKVFEETQALGTNWDVSTLVFLISDANKHNDFRGFSIYAVIYSSHGPEGACSANVYRLAGTSGHDSTLYLSYYNGKFNDSSSQTKFKILLKVQQYSKKRVTILSYGKRSSDVNGYYLNSTEFDTPKTISQLVDSGSNIVTVPFNNSTIWGIHNIMSNDTINNATNAVNADYSTFSNYLNKLSDSITINASSLDPITGLTKVWGEKFTKTKSGNINLELNTTNGGLSLHVDGDIYSGNNKLALASHTHTSLNNNLQLTSAGNEERKLTFTSKSDAAIFRDNGVGSLVISKPSILLADRDIPISGTPRKSVYFNGNSFCPAIDVFSGDAVPENKITLGSPNNSNKAFDALYLKESGIFYTPKDQPRSRQVVRFISGDSNGDGIIIGGAGLTAVGSGESATAVVSGASLSGSTETLYLSSDNHIRFYSNLQDGFSSGKQMVYENTGNLVVPGTVQSSGEFKFGSSGPKMVYDSTKECIKFVF